LGRRPLQSQDWFLEWMPLTCAGVLSNRRSRWQRSTTAVVTSSRILERLQLGISSPFDYVFTSALLEWMMRVTARTNSVRRIAGNRPCHVRVLARLPESPDTGELMKNAVRALEAIIVAAAALALISPAAHAGVLDEIVVAHRGGATAKYGEGTMASYKYSVANHADVLDADIHWTKDSSDPDTVGSILVIHDSTLDRITNCSGKVSSWLWTSIRDKCRTDAGKQPLIRLKDLIAYGNSVGKVFAVELKNSTITNAQASQLWKTLKYSNVQLEATSGRLAALNKIKKLDAADPYHKLKYALVISGDSGPWPSVSTVKSVGTYVHARLEIPSTVMTSYKTGGIKVFLYTGRTTSDYERMAKLNPYGVVVDNVAKFQAWRDSQT
jgi:glycerophosphoryl diester phosphodiesterase